MYFVILFSSSWQSDCDIFHSSNSNRLIYSGVLQVAQFCLFKMAVRAYSAYSKIAKSSPPLVRYSKQSHQSNTLPTSITDILIEQNVLRTGASLHISQLKIMNSSIILKTFTQVSLFIYFASQYIFCLFLTLCMLVNFHALVVVC